MIIVLIVIIGLIWLWCLLGANQKNDLTEKYIIDWETDYGEGVELSGECIISADSEENAKKKFCERKISKACITDIRRMQK